MIRIPYQLRGRYFLPVCEVTLLGDRFHVPLPAVIDSGAVWPIFTKWAAEQAGLPLGSGTPQEVVFGGSATIGTLLKTNVLIQHRRFELDIVYVDEIKLGYALLGRATFFDRFNQVAFHERTPERKNVQLRD
jgi:hypothetical protein